MKKLQKALLFCTCVLFITNAKAQSKTDTVYLRSSIVKDGYAVKPTTVITPNLHIDGQGVNIYTGSSEVFSLNEGEVTSIFSIAGNGEIILIRTDNTYYVYKGLASSTLKKGEKIVKGQIIGQFDTGKNYTLNFQIWNKADNNTAQLPADQVLALLAKS